MNFFLFLLDQNSFYCIPCCFKMLEVLIASFTTPGISFQSHSAGGQSSPLHAQEFALHRNALFLSGFIYKTRKTIPTSQGFFIIKWDTSSSQDSVSGIQEHALHGSSCHSWVCSIIPILWGSAVYQQWLPYLSQDWKIEWLSNFDARWGILKLAFHSWIEGLGLSIIPNCTPFRARAIGLLSKYFQ